MMDGVPSNGWAFRRGVQTRFDGGWLAWSNGQGRLPTPASYSCVCPNGAAARWGSHTDRDQETEERGGGTEGIQRLLWAAWFIQYTTDDEVLLVFFFFLSLLFASLAFRLLWFWSCLLFLERQKGAHPRWFCS